MRKPRSTPSVSPVTHTRRTVLEWLGQGVAVAALPPALSSCFPPVASDPCCGSTDSGSQGDSGGRSDRGDSGERLHEPDCPEGSFGFAPSEGAHEVYEGWNVRTVDPQDLEAILAGWVLTVDGLVDKPRSYTFQELLELARLDQVMDFHCVEGWSVHDVPWNGLHLSTLLKAAGVKDSATHITFHTIDGIYNESLPM
jgi:hypothetical protein